MQDFGKSPFSVVLEDPPWGAVQVMQIERAKSQSSTPQLLASVRPESGTRCVTVDLAHVRWRLCSGAAAALDDAALATPVQPPLQPPIPAPAALGPTTPVAHAQSAEPQGSLNALADAAAAIMKEPPTPAAAQAKLGRQRPRKPPRVDQRQQSIEQEAAGKVTRQQARLRSAPEAVGVAQDTPPAMVVKQSVVPPRRKTHVAWAGDTPVDNAAQAPTAHVPSDEDRASNRNSPEALVARPPLAQQPSLHTPEPLQQPQQQQPQQQQPQQQQQQQQQAQPHAQQQQKPSQAQPRAHQPKTAEQPVKAPGRTARMPDGTPDRKVTRQQAKRISETVPADAGAKAQKLGGLQEPGVVQLQPSMLDWSSDDGGAPEAAPARKRLGEFVQVVPVAAAPRKLAAPVRSCNWCSAAVRARQRTPLCKTCQSVRGRIAYVLGSLTKPEIAAWLTPAVLRKAVSNVPQGFFQSDKWRGAPADAAVYGLLREWWPADRPVHAPAAHA